YFRIVAFLSKCVFIHRDGTKEHKMSILDNCARLVRGGEVVTVFPEGRRSRTGRFEAERLTYGVGKIVASAPGARVLCVYLRSDRQETFSNYPPKGSRFRVSMELIEPKTSLPGSKGYQEI